MGVSISCCWLGEKEWAAASMTIQTLTAAWRSLKENLRWFMLGSIDLLFKWFIHSFIHLFTHSLIYIFIYSSIYPSICSFIHWFIHSLIHICYRRRCTIGPRIEIVGRRRGKRLDLMEWRRNQPDFWVKAKLPTSTTPLVSDMCMATTYVNIKAIIQ